MKSEGPTILDEEVVVKRRDTMIEELIPAIFAEMDIRMTDMIIVDISKFGLRYFWILYYYFSRIDLIIAVDSKIN